MTIDEAYRLVQFISNKKQRGNVSPDDFNLLAKQKQLELTMKRLGNPKTIVPGQSKVPVIHYPMNQKIHDDILPLFGKPKTITLNASGEASLPSDYMRLESLNSSHGKNIDLLTYDKFIIRQNDRIKPPHRDYPIAYMSASLAGTSQTLQRNIEVLPVNASSIKFSYIRLPNDPNWDYTFGDDQIPLFKPRGTGAGESGKESADFELPADTHNEIVALILQAVGINLDTSSVFQYGQIKEQQGT